MTEFWMYIAGLFPAVISAVLAFYVQRRQKKRDEDMERHAEARKREAHLSLEMQMATAKLAYAVAMAAKRGTPNGEVEDGIEAYNAAKKNYLEFLNEQAAEYIAS